MTRSLRSIAALTKIERDDRTGRQAGHQQDQVDLLVEARRQEAEPDDDIEDPFARPAQPLIRPEADEHRSERTV